eukprot:3879434-Amphidinium_carterae.1
MIQTIACISYSISTSLQLNHTGSSLPGTSPAMQKATLIGHWGSVNLSQSGEVHNCTRGLHRQHLAALPLCLKNVQGSMQVMCRNEAFCLVNRICGSRH